MINYWAIPNMGKMHMMQLIEINKKSYTKNNYPYYFYKQWHHPDDYGKRIEKTLVVRKGGSTIETAIKTKTTFGEKPFIECTERHEYLDKADKSSIDTTKMHSNTSEVGGDLMVKYFGGLNERRPPDVLMKDKDLVEVFFTDKWFCEKQKHFPVSPSKNYWGTVLEPYMRWTSSKSAMMEYWRNNIRDELMDVDIIFEPFTIMGRNMIGTPSHSMDDESKNETYVLSKYKLRKNVIPYKENLVDCFASKIKRWSHNGKVEDYLDKVVRDLRRIEVYFIKKGLEPVYFNMDRDDYTETFGFDKNELPRDQTHPGDYPERDQYEQIAKDYISKRNMRDMRRRGRKYDWI
tara:strand:+ start:42 stop:1082 length:1041 start_codon:yes stop_codon:yes gene_type:complete